MKLMRPNGEEITLPELTPEQELQVDRMWAKHQRQRWSKTCSLCHTVHTWESWQKLPHPPAGKYQEDGDGVLELRNCTCHTTLAIALDRDGDPL